MGQQTLRDKAYGCSAKMVGRQRGNPVNIIATDPVNWGTASSSPPTSGHPGNEQRPRTRSGNVSGFGGLSAHIYDNLWGHNSLDFIT